MLFIITDNFILVISGEQKFNWTQWANSKYCMICQFLFVKPKSLDGFDGESKIIFIENCALWMGTGQTIQQNSLAGFIRWEFLLEMRPSKVSHLDVKLESGSESGPKHGQKQTENLSQTVFNYLENSRAEHFKKKNCRWHISTAV